MAARWWLLLVVCVALSIAAVEVGVRFSRRPPAQPTRPKLAANGKKQPDRPIEPVELNASPHVYRRVVALCIGIETYKHLPEAPYAENDAKKVGESLQANYRFSPEFLLGTNATRVGIWSKLNQLGKELGPNDVLIVFFAGHGQVINLPSVGRTGFLMPYDAEVDLGDHRDLQRWRETGIEMRDILRLLQDKQKMQTQHVLFIVDACCSGFLTRRGNFEERIDLQKLLVNPSRMVLAATTERQAARADRSRRHGIFTAALLDVLNTNDAASVTDVFLEVRKRVARGSEGTMTPQMSHVADGELVFLPAAIPGVEIKTVMNDLNVGTPLRENSALRGVIKRAQERVNLRTTMHDVIEAFETGDYRYTIYAAERARAWEEKRTRLQQNAASGDVLAMIAMHYCEARGLGTEPDPITAYRWAKLAFESGHPGGKHVLGRCLLYKIGVTQNENAGFKLIDEAADAKFPISLLQKGMDFIETGDFEKAELIWKQAANYGVNTANYYLALYQSGLKPFGKGRIPGTKDNPRRAMEFLLPAARAGLPSAQHMMLGIVLDIDESNRKDAADWLEKAAANGDSFAQVGLARELARNYWILEEKDTPYRLGLKQDEKAAVRWARLAADQTNSTGHVLLACFYWKGCEAFLPNHDKALDHCNKAAKMNHHGAFILQSKWHLEGILLPKDRDKALSLAERAAGINKREGGEWLSQLKASDE